MQTAPPNLLADYLYLQQTAVVKQAIDTARTSVPSGGHSSSYLCHQDSVFAAQDRRLGRTGNAVLDRLPREPTPPDSPRRVQAGSARACDSGCVGLFEMPRCGGKRLS